MRGAVLHAVKQPSLAAMNRESRLRSIATNRSGSWYGKQGDTVSLTLSTLEAPVRRAESVGS